MNALAENILFNLNVKSEAAWKRECPTLMEKLADAGPLAPALETALKAAFQLGYGARVSDEGHAGIVPFDLVLGNSGPTV